MMTMMITMMIMLIMTVITIMLFLMLLMRFSDFLNDIQGCLFDVFLDWTKPGQLLGSTSSAKEAEKDISLCFRKDWKNPYHPHCKAGSDKLSKVNNDVYT